MGGSKEGPGYYKTKGYHQHDKKFLPRTYARAGRQEVDLVHSDGRFLRTNAIW